MDSHSGDSRLLYLDTLGLSNLWPGIQVIIGLRNSIRAGNAADLAISRGEVLGRWQSLEGNWNSGVRLVLQRTYFVVG